jgi:copper chaperone CopZ
VESERRLTAKKIPIVRMECPTCIPILEREVEKLEGVKEVRGSYMTKILKVTYDPDLVPLQEIEASIERLGYRIAYKRYTDVISRIKGLLRRGKPSRVEVVSDADFPEKVLRAPKPVAVLFTTQTCPTCRVLKHAYEDAAEGLGGKAELYEMDITSTETWRRFDIRTILIFLGGEVSERFDALPRREDIEEALMN